MKRLIRLYDEDLKNIVMERFDCRPSDITMTYTEDVDENENVTPVFYIEVEEHE